MKSSINKLTDDELLIMIKKRVAIGLDLPSACIALTSSLNLFSNTDEFYEMLVRIRTIAYENEELRAIEELSK